jgi:hypothetical protein
MATKTKKELVDRIAERTQSRHATVKADAGFTVQRFKVKG